MARPCDDRPDGKLEFVLITGFPAGLLQCNCYVLAPHPGADAIVVDPGQRAMGQLRRILDQNRLTPAAVLLTRVVSRPTSDRVTVDLGTKAVATDSPAGKRVVFPALPDAVHVAHNEEHLVVKTPRAGEFQPGDELLAIPRHICPTCALHKEVCVISSGKLVDRWEITARDRKLTI